MRRCWGSRHREQVRKEPLQGQHGNITSRRDEAGSRSRSSHAGLGGQPGSGGGVVEWSGEGEG